jgi:hypothetical protein
VQEEIEKKNQTAAAIKQPQKNKIKIKYPLYLKKDKNNMFLRA